MAFEAITSAVLNALGSGNLTQAEQFQTIPEPESNAPFSLISAVYGADEPPDLTVVPDLPKGPRHDWLQEQIDHMRSGGDVPGGDWVSDQRRQEIIKELQDAQYREGQGEPPPSIEDALSKDPTYVPPGDIYTGPKLVPPLGETRGFWSNIGRGLAGLGATAVSTPVLAGIAGVGSALYPTRMGDAYIGEPVTSNVPLRDGTVRAGDTTFADQVAAEKYGVQRYTADPAKEAAATMGYLKPEEFGLDPFTNEQIREARATFQRLMEETPEEVSQYISPTADPYIYQDQIAEALRNAQAEQTLFTGDEVDVASRAPLNLAGILRDVGPPPTWFPPTTSSGIGGMVEEPATSPFIGDAGFTPSLDARTLGGPEVGDEEEEVSEERVKVIKKKPKEKRTSVEEQVVVASEVKKALDNASKGKKVKNELKAIVELAKVDPTIVKRYTTPGSQALQDITAQVDSFSFMPTIQKKKKTVDPWAFEDRRGGRR